MEQYMIKRLLIALVFIILLALIIINVSPNKSLPFYTNMSKIIALRNSTIYQINLWNGQVCNIPKGYNITEGYTYSILATSNIKVDCGLIKIK